MRETHQPPTTSPAGPPHDRAHTCHSRTHPRHSHVGGNPPRCVHTPEKMPPPTVDGNRHNATEFDEPLRKLVPARDARRRQRRSVPFSRHGLPQAAAGSTLRHSREGGNPPRCDHTPEETAPFSPATKSDRIRQKSTETRVRAFPNSRAYARARGDAVPFPFSRHGDCPQSGSRLDSSPSFPHPRHSRVGGNPSRCAIRRTAWSCRPQIVISIDQTKPPAALC